MVGEPSTLDIVAAIAGLGGMLAAGLVRRFLLERERTILGALFLPALILYAEGRGSLHLAGDVLMLLSGGWSLLLLHRGVGRRKLGRSGPGS